MLYICTFVCILHVVFSQRVKLLLCLSYGQKVVLQFLSFLNDLLMMAANGLVPIKWLTLTPFSALAHWQRDMSHPLYLINLPELISVR